jgi:hypothetical protein
MTPKHTIDSANVTSHGKKLWLASRRLRASKSWFDIAGFFKLELRRKAFCTCKSTRNAAKQLAEIEIKVNAPDLRRAAVQRPLDSHFSCLDKPCAQPNNDDPKGGAGYENKQRSLRSARVKFSKTLRHLFDPTPSQHHNMADARTTQSGTSTSRASSLF